MSPPGIDSDAEQDEEILIDDDTGSSSFDAEAETETALTRNPDQEPEQLSGPTGNTHSESDVDDAQGKHENDNSLGEFGGSQGEGRTETVARKLKESSTDVDINASSSGESSVESARPGKSHSNPGPKDPASNSDDGIDDDEEDGDHGSSSGSDESEDSTADEDKESSYGIYADEGSEFSRGSQSEELSVAADANDPQKNVSDAAEEYENDFSDTEMRADQSALAADEVALTNKSCAAKEGEEHRDQNQNDNGVEEGTRDTIPDTEQEQDYEPSLSINAKNIDSPHASLMSVQHEQEDANLTSLERRENDNEPGETARQSNSTVDPAANQESDPINPQDSIVTLDGADIPSLPNSVEATPAKSVESVQVPASVEATPAKSIESIIQAPTSADVSARTDPDASANAGRGVVEESPHTQDSTEEPPGLVSELSGKDAESVQGVRSTEQVESGKVGQPVEEPLAKSLQDQFTGESDEGEQPALSVASSHEAEPLDAEAAAVATEAAEHAGDGEESAELGEQGLFAEAQRAEGTVGDPDPLDGLEESPGSEMPVKARQEFEDDIVYVEAEVARQILGLHTGSAGSEAAGSDSAASRSATADGSQGSAGGAGAGRGAAGVRRPGSSWVEVHTRVKGESSRGWSGRQGAKRKEAGRQRAEVGAAEGGESRAGGGRRQDRGEAEGGEMGRGEGRKLRPAWDSRLFLPARATSALKHEQVLRWVPPPSQGRPVSSQLSSNPSFEYPRSVASEPSAPAERSRDRVGNARGGAGGGARVSRSKSSLALSSASSSSPARRRPATSLGSAAPADARQPQLSSPAQQGQYQYNKEGVRGGAFGSGGRREGGGCRRTEIQKAAEGKRSLPGPHSYEIRREASARESGGVMGSRYSGPGSLEWTLRASAAQPGPSHYDAEGSAAKRIPGGHISSSRFSSSIHTNSNPGPADYEPGPSRSRRVLGTVIKDGKVLGAADMALFTAAKTPGPGQYNLPPLGHVRGGGFGGASRSTSAQQDRDFVPGPGAYTTGLSSQSSTSVGLRSMSTMSFGPPSGSNSNGIRPVHHGHRVTVFDVHMSQMKKLPGPATYDTGLRDVARKVEQKPMIVGRGNWPSTLSRGATDPVVYKCDGDTCSVNADRRAIQSLQRKWEASAQQFAALLKAAGLPDTPQPSQPSPPPAPHAGTDAAVEAASEPAPEDAAACEDAVQAAGAEAGGSAGPEAVAPGDSGGDGEAALRLQDLAPSAAAAPHAKRDDDDNDARAMEPHPPEPNALPPPPQAVPVSETHAATQETGPGAAAAAAGGDEGDGAEAGAARRADRDEAAREGAAPPTAPEVPGLPPQPQPPAEAAPPPPVEAVKAAPTVEAAPASVPAAKRMSNFKFDFKRAGSQKAASASAVGSRSAPVAAAAPQGEEPPSQDTVG